jgi:hypothetical protein
LRYLLKDRVLDAGELVAALERVASGTHVRAHPAEAGTARRRSDNRRVHAVLAQLRT